MLIAGAAVVCVVLSLLITSQQQPQYRTSLQVLFRETTIGQQVAGVPVFENPQASSSAGAEMTTNVTLLGSEEVAKGVIRDLGLKTDVQRLLRTVNVEQVGLSNIGKVTVRADNRDDAQRIANSWGKVFINQRRQADQAKLGEAIDLLNARLDATPATEQRTSVTRQTRAQLQRLELLKSVQDGNAEVVQPAGRPDQPFTPRKKRAAAIAAVLGALLGLGIASISRALDRRLKTPEEVSELLGVPVVAELSPAVFRRDATLVAGTGGAVAESWKATEEFRTLATNLRYLGVDRQRRSVAVTSAAPAEGKTTTVSNLALTLAKMGRRTALIDADLRRGRLHSVFGLDPQVGLSSVAAGFTSADEAWSTVTLQPEGTELAVLPAGPPPPDPVQILESSSIVELTTEAIATHDYVLVDTPPALVVSDAVAIAQMVDAVLVVVRLGKTTRDQLKRLMTSLDQVGVRPIGAVVTGVKRTSSYYSGAYGYYDETPSTEQRADPKASQRA